MAVSAKTLFEVVFALILEEKKKLIPAVDAVIMVTVSGDGGGVWTLDLRRDGDGEVHRGAADNPDLSLVLAHDFLDDFLKGQYDAKAVMEAGRLGVMGSPKVFQAFIALLTGQTRAPKTEKIAKPKKGGVQLRK